MEICDRSDETPLKSIRILLQTWRQAVMGRELLHPPDYQGPDIRFRRFVEDSRQVRPGDCFVARARRRHDGQLYSDGRPFISQAVAAGAVLVIVAESNRDYRSDSAMNPDNLEAADHVPVIHLSEEGFAWLAAAWHGFPAQQMTLIGITGTDGKTSIADLLFEILTTAGIRTGLISTIKAVIGDEEEPTGLHVTTPEAPAVQGYLHRMAEAGLTHCILETTSHGWAQYRVGAIHFDVAIVSNIQHEHLDYHGSFAGYVAAKARLFASLNMPPLNVPAASHKVLARRVGVLNRDDQSYDTLRQIVMDRHLDYSLSQRAVVTASNIEYGAAGTRFTLRLGKRPNQPGPPAWATEWQVRSKLVGAFNLYNMLAAAAAAHALEIDPDHIVRGIANLEAISGRMERIDRGQPFMVLVDFAHTPNALKQVVSAARQMTPGRIILVFGSAGKRDVDKRRLMAQIAIRQADLAVLTAEDPRDESLQQILEMMASGARGEGGIEGRTFWRIPDRGRAIYFALSLAQSSQDLVMVCGKGHEQSMNFAGIEYPWDDRTATRAALDAFLAGKPMVDLGLPTFPDNYQQE